MNLSPTLSVILTCHDRYPLLRYAIDSVLKQDLPNIELIVCDDDSSDPRIAALLGMLEEEDLARVHRGPAVPQAYRGAREMVGEMVNAGLYMARGKYVSLLCDDDAYLPDRCSKLVAVLEARPEVDVVFDWCWWLTADGKRQPHGYLESYRYRKPLYSGHMELSVELGPPNYVCHDSAMFRRERWAASGVTWKPLREHTPVDWRFWCDLKRAGLRFVRVETYGEEAYTPGVWGSADIETAARARGIEEAGAMGEIRYARNVSGKTQVVGRGFIRNTVLNGDRIRAEVVEIKKAGGRIILTPGFEYCEPMRVPEVSCDPVKLVEPAEPTIREPLLTEGPPTEAKAPVLTEAPPVQTDEGGIPSDTELDEMGPQTVRALARKLGLQTAGLKKADILKMIKAVRK